MAKEFIREIKGRKYKYLTYWDRVEKRSKQKYLGRVDIEKTIILKVPNEKEAAEVIVKIGGGLIERKHLEKWIKRLKIKENMDMLRSLFVEQ
ncbi:hypothetical protein ANME2D_00691 [Candidatus Methanoperedens nitroreducens]|uniref:Uncharacterized protein n=1 Tax=Candidatus Methanoperedens nitratireducens TaxID=1392998 RepID=A0A062VEJ4_9EURY|nr:hypothetical protein [Candidatus Methanoperedens nitroreducens]KCZ73620.1 hypothetical protein ANME2D_00691 [Candidatus Methanoperedens nitroreducens]MDJ1422421.1 hypothetical protein [Candidatus Methanoperedens sp.]